MTPLRYIAHDNKPHFHRKHIALVSMGLGFIVGFLGTVAVRTVRDAMPTEKQWQPSPIVCTASAHDGDRHTYFLRNNGPDFVIKSPMPVYGLDSRGLIPSAGMLQPVTIPQGMVIAATVIGQSREYVLLDVAARRRLEMR